MLWLPSENILNPALEVSTKSKTAYFVGTIAQKKHKAN